MLCIVALGGASIVYGHVPSVRKSIRSRLSEYCRHILCTVCNCARTLYARLCAISLNTCRRTWNAFDRIRCQARAAASGNSLQNSLRNEWHNPQRVGSIAGEIWKRHHTTNLYFAVATAQATKICVFFYVVLLCFCLKDKPKWGRNYWLQLSRTVGVFVYVENKLGGFQSVWTLICSLWVLLYNDEGCTYVVSLFRSIHFPTLWTNPKSIFPCMHVLFMSHIDVWDQLGKLTVTLNRSKQ